MHIQIWRNEIQINEKLIEIYNLKSNENVINYEKSVRAIKNSILISLYSKKPCCYTIEWNFII